MLTNSKGNWEWCRSCGVFGYRCKTCGEWVPYGLILMCKCGKKEEPVKKETPMNIVDWFNPKDIKHLRAYRHLVEEGSWPAGFKPEGMEMPTGWNASLTAKMAAQYVDDMIRHADNYAEIQKHKEEREARIAEEKASRPKADKILELMKEGWVLMGLPHGIPGDFRMRPPPNADRRLRMLTVHHMSATKLIRNKQIVVDEKSMSSLRRTEYRLA